MLQIVVESSHIFFFHFDYSHTTQHNMTWREKESEKKTLLSVCFNKLFRSPTSSLWAWNACFSLLIFERLSSIHYHHHHRSSSSSFFFVFMCYTHVVNFNLIFRHYCFRSFTIIALHYFPLSLFVNVVCTIDWLLF